MGGVKKKSLRLRCHRCGAASTHANPVTHMDTDMGKADLCRCCVSDLSMIWLLSLPSKPPTRLN